MQSGIDPHPLDDIPAFVDTMRYRAVADGVPLPDIDAARAQVESWEGWSDFWTSRSFAHEAAADRSLENGGSLSAGHHLVRAALCSHYAQYFLFTFPEPKRRAAERKVALFHRAAGLLDPPFRRVEIPYGTVNLPALVAIPVSEDRVPCVVHIGGLDAAKEDAYDMASRCLERGMAVLLFDGPGQGEAYYRGTRMSADSHTAVSAAIDAASQIPEIDPERIGVIGRSLGGYFGPRAAADDSRIKACVAWGAVFSLSNFWELPPVVKDGLQFVAGAVSWEEANDHFQFLNLSEHASRISCPVLVVHGGRDLITPPENAERFAAHYTGPLLRLDLHEESMHCNHDIAHIVRPDMADWLMFQLGSMS